MKPFRIPPSPILTAVLLPALFVSAALAHESGRAPRRGSEIPVSPGPPQPLAAALDRSLGEMPALLVDAPGDGSVWARGIGYKIGFERSGATFYPSFGPSAPKNFPHRLSPVAVSIDGGSLALDRDVLPSRTGESVRYERGGFSERYELRDDSLEQSFEFRALPRRGELALRIEVGSELAAFTDAAGIGFRGPLGEVRYGRATAIDASGASCEAPTQLEGGAILIRVPADFVARAALPLIVDPVVSGVPIDTTTADTFSPDLAWEPFHLGWLAVYEQTFSATDTDVYAKFLDAAGTPLLSGAVDLSTARWDRPRCANLAAAHEFVVVAGVTNGSAKTVRGRSVTPNGGILSMTPQYEISDASSGDKVLPDVGGDPSGTLPSFCCVAYEQDVSPSDKRIVFRLIGADGTPQGGGPTVVTAANVDLAPSVSNSNRAEAWLIAWTRDGLTSFGDIRAVYVSWDGVVNTATFAVSGGSQIDGPVCASTGLVEPGLHAVAFQRIASLGTSDIMVSLLDGTSVVETANLHSLEGTGTGSRRQIQPSIDSNGVRFLVGYSEIDATFSHEDLFVTELYPGEAGFTISQPHVALQAWGLPQLRSRIGAQHAIGASSPRFLALYDITGASTNRDVAGQLFDAFEGGSSSPFCFGDGTGGTCPCNLAGQPGRGCPNRNFLGGSTLSLTGGCSTTDDDVVLHGTAIALNQPCVFLQGTTELVGIPYGEGLRCVGGSVVRLAVKSSVAGFASYPEPGDLPLAERGGVPFGGGLRTYQIWYRDAAPGVCSHPDFNLSNGLRVLWAP